ncbi:ATP-dependent nuclease subunit B [Campylobacter sp. MIT 21-1685]|uniref:tetratricopeptide repeat protein n=1 Tax=unclassified Campylobacter TaxID=2593542 RepID=UPI00224AD33D|nr:MULTISPECIES: ATP-dependent nuclease subunit B [unclassified Campylobacter]MCX2683222.1 ATP-dependent nuclease subunit B [Campylobacter sp. MIT 21-1684]MCX2751458.1 ATP-dependent nuclease subunit B [Campylobacter sp. MIT 21-1682]MCX2807703.1 ATP-dependent nuclease subunit B [Campylobacter sp. MIT 21-1685]
MYRNLLFIVVLLFLISCARNQSIVFENYKEQRSNAFDLQVMKAYNYEYFGEALKARDEFLNLFKQHKILYFLENAFILTLVNDLDKKEELNTLVKSYRNESDTLKRLSALYALNSYNVKEAQRLLNELLEKKDNDPRNFELQADIFVRQNQFKEALKYYKLAFEQIQTEDLLLKLVGVYGLLDQVKQIQNLLEDFRKENGCTLKTCVLLAKIYNDEQNVSGLEELYKELYILTGNHDFALSLVELLNTQGKQEEALKIALEYNLDDEVKLYLYQNLKQFDEAKVLSLRMYQKDKRKEYLLRAAIFEFEAAQNTKNVTQQVLHSVTQKFSSAIESTSDPLYLNYYGYLLIDYDLDVKKGMKLVGLALAKDEENLYYLDSLAWGYYKLKQCDKALMILEKTFFNQEFANSQESKSHIEAIKLCLAKGKE